MWSSTSVSYTHLVDLDGMASPEVFGVVLKKHGIKLFAEAIDIEILEGFFLALVDCGAEIAAHGNDVGPKPHVRKGFPF